MPPNLLTSPLPINLVSNSMNILLKLVSTFSLPLKMVSSLLSRIALLCPSDIFFYVLATNFIPRLSLVSSGRQFGEVNSGAMGIISSVNTRYSSTPGEQVIAMSDDVCNGRFRISSRCWNCNGQVWKYG